MQNQQVISGNGKTVTDLQAEVTTSNELPKYYVSGCIEIEGTVGHAQDDEAEFYTLYERKENGLSHALMDCSDRLSAEAAMAVYVERDALQEQVQQLAAENCIQDIIISAIRDLARETDGVAGWHLNGDLATWDEVLPELSESDTPATDTVIREIGAKAVESCDDAKRMNWLCSHVVQVRKPLLYGSHEMFYAQCDSDDCEEYHSTLREQVDAAIRAGEQP